MSSMVFFVVLCAALLSASWNGIVKAGSDKALEIVLVTAGAGLISALALPFVPQPAFESWPYLAASAVLEPIYYLLLAAAYRVGDMSEAYPLMRGTAPLLVALAGGPLIGEALSPHEWVGVALICAGAIGLALEAHRRSGWHRSAARFAFANAAVIAAYTLIDGVGVRKSGAPLGYVTWLFMLTALPPLSWALLLRRRELVGYARGRLRRGFMGGAATVGSYGPALWAMTLAPVALVAALRETSILFATAIAAIALRERIGWPRYIAIALIVSGSIAIRLAS